MCQFITNILKWVRDMHYGAGFAKTSRLEFCWKRFGIFWIYDNDLKAAIPKALDNARS